MVFLDIDIVVLCRSQVRDLKINGRDLRLTSRLVAYAVSRRPQGLSLGRCAFRLFFLMITINCNNKFKDMNVVYTLINNQLY